jgi:hypothetical protein
MEDSMNDKRYSANDPRQYSQQTRQQFDDLVSHLRDDVSRVNDPQATALFETAAEVMQGLSKAFKHFEQSSEEAWKS